MKKILFCLICLVSVLTLQSVNAQFPVWENMKYGLFVHFVYGGEYGGMTPISSAGVYPANIDEFAESFDVQKFANDVQNMGFEYVILTAWHANMGVLYPSKVMADYGFDQRDHYTSKRDLLGEIMDSLAVRGIEFSIYTHIFVGHDFHPQGSGYFSYDNKNGTITQDMINSGYVDAVNGDSKKWNDFVNAVYDEMSTRYGEKVCSYWFDGTWVPNSWVDKQRMMETIRKSNKKCTFVANGTESHGLPYSSKEVNNVTKGEYSFSKDYQGVVEQDVNTWPSYKRHIALVQSGNWWASQWGNPRFSAEQVYRFTVFQASANNNGGVGWSFSPFVNGTWEGDMLSRMTKVGNYIAPVAESLKKTRASTSYVTKEGTRITALPGKYVATKSVNGLYEYIHVLNQPEGRSFKLPNAVDGRVFSEAILLEKNKPVEMLGTVRGYTLKLPEGEDWHPLNTVFKLKLGSFSLSGLGGVEKFVNPWKENPVKVTYGEGNTLGVTYNADTCSITTIAGVEYVVSQVLGPVIMQAKVDTNAKLITVLLDKQIVNQTSFHGLSLYLNGDNNVVIDSIVYQPGDDFLIINLNVAIVKNDVITLDYVSGNIKSLEELPMLNVSGFIVDNLLEGSSPRLVKAVTDFDGDNVILSFNKNMILPSQDDFTIFNSTHNQNISFSSISFDGDDLTKIVLSATDKILVTDVLTFSCNANSISSIDGGFLKAIDNFSVINIAPGISPQVVAANVKVDAYTLEMELDKPILDISHLKSNFKVEVNGVGRALKSADAINGDVSSLIFIVLEAPVKFGDKVTISFSGNTISSLDGGLLTGIDEYPAVNNVPDIYEPKHFLDISGVGSSGIQRDTLYISRLIYTDRDYIFTDIPSALVGAEYIRWANGAKSNSADVLLSFEIATSGKLYIAHDNRINKPAWLTQNFSRIIEVIVLSGTNSQLYFKTVKKGDKINLGANQIKGTETGSCNHYVVFFVPDPALTNDVSDLSVFNNLIVYPNPTSSKLFFAGLEGVLKVSVKDLSGQTILDQVGSNLSSVDLQGLQQGLYFVVFKTKYGCFTVKVLIKSKMGE